MHPSMAAALVGTVVLSLLPSPSASRLRTARAFLLPPRNGATAPDPKRRTAAEGDEHSVELRIVSHELEADGAGALAGGEVQAVLNQVGAVRSRDLPREQAGVLVVLAFEPERDGHPH